MTDSGPLSSYEAEIQRPFPEAEFWANAIPIYRDSFFSGDEAIGVFPPAFFPEDKISD